MIEPENRTIVHLDLDTFFVSVERLVNSKLIGKPVIIGGTSDRGVVAACSYESRAFGVHSAMPMHLAKRLCSQAVFIRGDMDLYSKYSRLVTEIIADKAPVFEKASIDEHYLDITGMDKFFGSLKWSHELRERITKETGLPISFGLSTNKTVSKIATGEAKPNGELHIPPVQIKPFLYPLSIRKIPMIGNKSYRLLRSMGVSTIKTLSMVPPDILKQVMGKNGKIIWRKANGIDPSPVKPYHETKSMGTEQTFDKDTIDVKRLKEILIGMTEKTAFELRRANKLTGNVTVKIRYSNYDTHTLRQRIGYTSFDHILLSRVLNIFENLYSRRMLIRLIGIRFSDLVSGHQQLNLFEDTAEMASLYQAMDDVRNRFGNKAIRRAVF